MFLRGIPHRLIALFTFSMLTTMKNTGSRPSRPTLRAAAAGTVLIAALSLAACGDDDKDSDETTTATTTAETTAATTSGAASDADGPATGEPDITTDGDGYTIDSGDGNSATVGEDGINLESDNGASADIDPDGTINVDDGEGNTVEVPGVEGLGDALDGLGGN